MSNFQGSGSIQEQPKKRTFNKANGWATVRTWIGERDDIFDFASELAVDNLAENVDVTDDGPTGTVTATYPDAQNTSLDLNQDLNNVEWQLLGNDIEKDLQTHPTLRPSETDVAEQANSVILDKWLSSPPNPPSIADPTAIQIRDYFVQQINGLKKDSGAADTKCKNRYLLHGLGVQSYVLTQYVIRKSIKVGRLSLVQASLTNVNRVESPSVSGMPLTLLFALPTKQYYNQVTSALEWLKKPPSVRALGNGKFSIEQEWWGADQWSTLLYGGTKTP